MNISILGAGSWGATLAYLFSNGGKNVLIWSSNEDKVAQINESKFTKNSINITFNNLVKATSDLTYALTHSNIIVICCTSETFRDLINNITAKSKASNIDISNHLFVSGVKGIETKSFSSMSQIFNSVLPGYNIAVLSGPNLASEILQDLPCASVIACVDENIAKYLQTALTTSKLRLYSNNDILGVELGGAYKNVIAIAAGICDGLNLGINAKASLLTRGISEMSRCAIAFGAQPQTIWGLSGTGDLFATCSSNASRNYSCGLLLASKHTLNQIYKILNAQIEGIPTAFAISDMALTQNINLPIINEVNSVLTSRISPAEAIDSLMCRPLVRE